MAKHGLLQSSGTYPDVALAIVGMPMVVLGRLWESQCSVTTRFLWPPQSLSRPLTVSLDVDEEFSDYIYFFKHDRSRLSSPLTEAMDGREVMKDSCTRLYWRVAAKFVSGVA